MSQLVRVSVHVEEVVVHLSAVALLPVHVATWSVL